MSFIKKFGKKVFESIKEWAKLVKEDIQMTPMEQKYLASLIKDKKYLEIGAGDSTTWAAKYATQVDSVEVRKQWYNKVVEMTAEQDNVTVYLFEPEPCAYSKTGNEIWSGNPRKDYGRREEFVSYIEKIKELVQENDYDIILIDGMVRDELAAILKELKYTNPFLVHDISSRNPPKMDYNRLDTTIFDIEGIVELSHADRLYCFIFKE